MIDQESQSNKTAISFIAVVISIIVATIFGGGNIASKFGLQGFSPLLFASITFTLTSVGLYTYSKIIGINLHPHSQQVWRLHLISGVLFTLLMASALIGLKLTLASRAEIFIASHPFFVVIFNSIGLDKLGITKERLSRIKILGLSICFAGLLTVFGDRLDSVNTITWVGDTLLISTSVLIALLILHIRKVTTYVSPIQATFWQIFFSLPLFYLGTIIFENPITINLSLMPLVALFYNGLIVYGLAYVIRAKLFQLYSANTISSFLLLSPIIGIFLAHILFGDPLTLGIQIGGLMVTSGVLIVYANK
jgi:drug/metabolite transporter (DMT)-like permease